MNVSVCKINNIYELYKILVLKVYSCEFLSKLGMCQ